ncbi:unnamed protein product [Lactuca virosa]|uniref:RING-type E3 ubiquitin transferase n=1 Tax=Lactuca virosa TaxID=75947 RepID=A0AAU9LQ62_9ASTR|nr:unnamed protein product [Lactuca virosa]
MSRESSYWCYRCTQIVGVVVVVKDIVVCPYCEGESNEVVDFHTPSPPESRWRLQPLPPTMSEFPMRSGFDRLLDQLSQIEINGLGRAIHPPVLKAIVESMPTIEISDSQVTSELHCVVCK